MSFSVFDDNSSDQRTPAPNNTNQGFILGLLIVGLLGVFVASQIGLVDFKQPNSPVPIVDDSQAVEPDENDSEKQSADLPAIDETYIVRVVESKISDVDGWLSDQIQNQKFWQVKVKGELGMGLETLDPFGDDGGPNIQAESFVAAGSNRGIEPPFWIHAHRGKVLTVTPFSKDVGEDAWLKIIKNSVKE